MRLGFSPVGWMSTKAGRWLGVAAALLAAALVYFSWLGVPRSRVETPRLVLLLSIDTLRADRVGPQGDAPSATPHLDKLASVSRRFTQARSPIPLTLPSHGSMLTGLYPMHHGSHDNGQPLESGMTLPELLQASGWKTAGFVSAAVLDSRFGIARGFETYDDTWIRRGPRQGVEQRGCEEVNAAAVRWLDTSGDSPRFVFVHYFEPHRDYLPPSPFKERFEGDPYRGEVAFADHCAGALLGALATRELLHDALVVITSDHGEGLGEHHEVTHGLLAYESTQHIPLLIKPPGSTRASVDERFVSLVDIAPTILSVLGVDAQQPMDGVDLFAEPSEEARVLWAQGRLPGGWSGTPVAAAYRDPFKYIHGLRPELFDLRADLGEERNLVVDRPRDAEALAAALAESGVLNAMQSAPAEALDPRTREMLLALGYASEETPSAAAPPALDPKDFARAYYRYVGLKGTVGVQSRLPREERDAELVRAVEREARRLQEQLPEVEALATVAADARRLLE